jgi:hypothetical protein
VYALTYPSTSIPCADPAWDFQQSLWLQRLLKTKHKNEVVISLANKIARMAWAVLTTNENYNPVMVKKYFKKSYIMF